MPSPARDMVPPYPCWEMRNYRLSRPVTKEDVSAILGNEELYVRDTAAGPVNIIHKYGILEIHCIIGESALQVWSDPAKGAYSSEYLEALIRTRF